jgi:hypothetical protein
MPEVVLRYDSGSVDGMSSNKNNQPGWAGIGWNLHSGHIVRHLKSCGTGVGANDLCLAGGESLTTDAFSIVLNGVSSRLVQESGNLYRLQRDPRWKAQLFTNGAAGNPDHQKQYWIVTTPDGTRYRFGGEMDPESGIDQNSVFYVTVRNTNNAVCGLEPYDLCNKAWQWNLDRVEDLDGNAIKYFYEQEKNFYKALGDSRDEFRKEYVRAGYLIRIEYSHRIGVGAITPTRALFAIEERCDSPCNWPANYLDTPGDLECFSSGSCSQNAPTFWSRRRLNYIETQYYNQSGSAWVSVARYDLAYTFPNPDPDAEGDDSEEKLWLASITQRLGDGSGGLPPVQYQYTMLAGAPGRAATTRSWGCRR